jgi:hypothetical protein
VKRVLTITVILLLLIPAQAHGASRGPCFGPTYEVKHSMTTQRQHHHVRGLIRCAVARWPVEGGYTTALRIATCESSLYAWAYSNGNVGLFQIRSWTDRAHYWLRHRWFAFHWLPRWQLARANVLVAVRWAHRFGWSAWSCN